MNKKILLFGSIICLAIICFFACHRAKQNNAKYLKKIELSRTEKDEAFKAYDDSPLTGLQKEVFNSLSYFPVSEKYKVEAAFHKNKNERIVKMAITDGSQREYYVYGSAQFQLNGKELKLVVYKPVKFSEDYFFIPFYDETSADLSYGGGRYVEPEIIDNATMEIDFNMAYNPYCAYNNDYRCPIPPLENKLNVQVLAGEKIPEFVH